MGRIICRNDNSGLIRKSSKRADESPFPIILRWFSLKYLRIPAENHLDGEKLLEKAESTTRKA
jgi:hypothetical protein